MAEIAEEKCIDNLEKLSQEIIARSFAKMAPEIIQTLREEFEGWCWHHGYQPKEIDIKLDDSALRIVWRIVVETDGTKLEFVTEGYDSNN